MNSVRELATSVLEMFEAQQRYFHAERDSAEKRSLLMESKRIEKLLRKQCAAIVGEETEALF